MPTTFCPQKNQEFSLFDSYQRNDKYSWLKKRLFWIKPYEDNCVLDEGNSANVNDKTSHAIAAWLIEFLARRGYEREFITACEKLGHKVSEKRMPVSVA